MTDSVLNAKIAAYYEARAAYDEAHEASVQADRVRRDRERELVDYMIENQIRAVDLADGTKPMLVSNTSISVVQENYDAIREWLLETVGDDKDFVVTIPHKPTVLEHVKKLLEEGVDVTELPSFLRCDTRPGLRVNGWKGKR